MKSDKLVTHILTMFLFFTLIFVQTGKTETKSALIEIDKGSYSNAVLILFPLAIQGELDAQMILSQLYFEGNGVAQDFDKALYWSCRATENGDLEALKSHKILTLQIITDTYLPWQCPSILDVK